MEEPTFGELLRRLRENAELTRAELHAKSGVSPNHIYKLESGERGKRINRATVLDLARGLGVPPGELLRAAGLRDDGGDVAVMRGRDAFKQFVNRDPLLRPGQKEALVQVYDQMVGWRGTR